MDFVTQAWAQAEGASTDASAGLLSLIPFVLIFVVFYFLLIYFLLVVKFAHDNIETHFIE